MVLPGRRKAVWLFRRSALPGAAIHSTAVIVAAPSGKPLPRRCGLAAFPPAPLHPCTALSAVARRRPAPPGKKGLVPAGAGVSFGVCVS